jgi:hypothetical protein
MHHLADRVALRGEHGTDQQHVRTVGRGKLKPLLRVLGEYRGGERAERLAEFDPPVEPVLHAAEPGVAQDRTCAE